MYNSLKLTRLQFPPSNSCLFFMLVVGVSLVARSWQLLLRCICTCIILHVVVVCVWTVLRLLAQHLHGVGCSQSQGVFLI